jgi:bis(5'-nucleosyl)-tetraphosphatase (symmetrical)
MAVYMIGDIQGCMPALEQLLQKLDFSPSRDTVYLLGDLVNRGPDSLGVLRWAMMGGTSVQPILGNHDLSLLAVAQGLRRPGRRDTLDAVLGAPDASVLLHWLRQQPLARRAHGWLMVHAGVLPAWTAQDALALSDEVHTALRGADAAAFLSQMFGNQPDQWSPSLSGAPRLRLVVNALTRMRLCDREGRMDFEHKEDAKRAPEGLMPWFEVPGRKTAGVPIAFGHWSTLQSTGREDAVALDTGCVWGGCLTAARLAQPPAQAPASSLEWVQIRCPQAQKP